MHNIAKKLNQWNKKEEIRLTRKKKETYEVKV